MNDQMYSTSVLAISYKNKVNMYNETRMGASSIVVTWNGQTFADADKAWLQITELCYNTWVGTRVEYINYYEVNRLANVWVLNTGRYYTEHNITLEGMSKCKWHYIFSVMLTLLIETSDLSASRLTLSTANALSVCKNVIPPAVSLTPSPP